MTVDVISIGFLVCVASLLCAIVLGFLDKKAENLSGRKDQQPREQGNSTAMGKFLVLQTFCKMYLS